MSHWVIGMLKTLTSTLMKAVTSLVDAVQHAWQRVLVGLLHVPLLLQNIYHPRFRVVTTPPYRSPSFRTTARAPPYALTVGCLTLCFTALPSASASSTPLWLTKAASYLGQGNTFNTDGQSWCADFVVVVAGQALPVNPSRAARKLYNAFRDADRLTTTPQPGDLIFYWRVSPNDWRGHVGFVESVSADTLTTIEGNVNGQVTRRRYPRQAVPRLLGYGRMQP